VTHSGPEVLFKTCVAMKLVDDDVGFRQYRCQSSATNCYWTRVVLVDKLTLQMSRTLHLSSESLISSPVIYQRNDLCSVNGVNFWAQNYPVAAGAPANQ